MTQPTTTKEFIMVLENKPGTLAEIGTALGKANVHITGFDMQSQQDFGTLRFATSEPAKTEQWLKGTRYTYRVRDLVTVPAEDRPGELGRIAQILGASGININAAYRVSENGSARIGFAVDDIPSAVKALST
jgi:hypothetical protein